MIILNCAVNEYPFQKALDYLDILTPTFFPLPEAAGIEFIPENGGGVGVRFSKPRD